jgi:hypothetical protein
MCMRAAIAFSMRHQALQYQKPDVESSQGCVQTQISNHSKEK